MRSTELSDSVSEMVDHYEFLQINPSASAEAIHRIYRFWAARYHPDNPDTGDGEKFCRVRAAYEVLSDPKRRANYDAMRSQPALIPTVPLSSMFNFMDDVEGETNRRLALLAILYWQRRADPRYPEVPLRKLEDILGFPSEYLDFTSWYLAQKGYMKRADNSDFTITVAGVDYVETQRANLPILNRLLTRGKLCLAECPVERRVNTQERRMGLPDTRPAKTERRQNRRDRRVNRTDLRAESFGAQKSD